ncbi:TetR family transcriptional regulator [Streptomyces sulfonofaciens]|uniref:TetR family transcriptional regulator n=1 Tax=Streptomyces sulfonofaciens TaxID=68272 RepID=A0A919G230_9ACTN|nr:TetR/AcrR family transcriptional regulator [Streptomyces sulfonofaciens]GHH76688.1 TetR family transcriptional regulator [Streptomyces sulfonofaciens]
MRTWADNDPKARLMARKREAIVNAALAAFLEEGYGGSSVNRIAASAGVSITTLYRHFDGKDDLFVAVIQAACDTSAQTADPQWLDLPPLEGLTEAGCELLRHILSEQQLALFRVVARDAQRFPELGRRYQQEILGDRTALFTRHLSRWPAKLRAKVSDPVRAAHVFSALLQAEIVDTALLGGPVPGPAAIRIRSHEAANDLLALAGAGRL